MSVLTTIIACLVGAVIGIIGAYYYTVWKAKKVVEGLMANLGNLKDPDALIEDPNGTNARSQIVEVIQPTKQASKIPDANLLLGLGIALVVMTKITIIFGVIGALFLVGWGWLLYDKLQKKKEIDLKAYGQKVSN